jgi:CRISPR-associated protein Csy2
MTYLVLPQLTVHGANAIACPLVLGYPSMTAINGLAHQVVRQIATETEMTVQLHSFVVLHHAAQLRVHGRWRNRLTQKRFVHTDLRTRKSSTGDRAHYMLSPSAAAMPEVDLTISLVFEVSAEPGFREALDDVSLESISIVGPKALGGTVQAVRTLQVHDELSAAIKSVPSCFVLCDRSQELLADDADPLDRLLNLLSEQPVADLSARRRLTPLQTGWRAISAPTRRETPRGEGLHCFAEPLIGLGEFVPRHIALDQLEAGAVWRPRINNGSFTVKGYQHG